MNNPLITVIIPCFNYDKYILEAIDSVHNQTYDNIELIVINDGSTDQSLEKIKNKREKYKFEIINQKNQGIVYTRNLGVSRAKGDYILQLDADDSIPINYIEVLVKESLKEVADIYYTPAVNLETKKLIIKAPEFNLERLKVHNFIHSSSLVRAKLLKKYKYDSNLNDYGYEDWDVFLSMCLDGAKALLVDSTQLGYRIHPDFPSRSDELNKSVKAIDANKYILNKHTTSHPKDMDYLTVVANWLGQLRDSILENEEINKQNNILEAELRYIKNSKLFRAVEKIRKLRNSIFK